MPQFDLDGVIIALDDKGYLTDFAAWTPVLAEALAAADGLAELTPAHWRVLEFLRAYQAKHGTAPMIRVLCRETGQSLQQIYDLFPLGPAKGACRVAGLPRPDSCV
jgi:tRNA 2-thiouridine synthesizing protein E